jgi:uncharacterized membrane protein YedE/YeeE
MATGVGWLSLAGVVLILVGLTLLILVDAPRRILGFFGHRHSAARQEPLTPAASGPSGPERAAHAPEAVGLWLTPPADPPRPTAPLWARQDPGR